MKTPHADGLCVCLCRFDLMFDRAAARLTFGISEFGFVVLFGCSVLFIAAVTNRDITSGSIVTAFVLGPTFPGPLTSKHAVEPRSRANHELV